MVLLAGGEKIDKRSRLAMTTEYIKSGKILFPLNGAEELITQMVGFGKEKHDDLVDAFSMMIIKIIESNPKPSIRRRSIVFRTPGRSWGWGTSGIFD